MLFLTPLYLDHPDICVCARVSHERTMMTQRGRSAALESIKFSLKRKETEGTHCSQTIDSSSLSRLKWPEMVQSGPRIKRIYIHTIRFNYCNISSWAPERTFLGQNVFHTSDHNRGGCSLVEEPPSLRRRRPRDPMNWLFYLERKATPLAEICERLIF